jgi:hypothetical protein
MADFSSLAIKEMRHSGILAAMILAGYTDMS